MKAKVSKEEAAAMADADEYRRLVLERTGLQADELKCPREKSEMTPCIARDGGLAVAFTASGTAICAGCENGVSKLLGDERKKAAALAKARGEQ